MALSKSQHKRISSQTKKPRASRPAAKRSSTAREKASSLTDRAFEAAQKINSAGLLDSFDRITFAWGWANGYKAARREQCNQ